MPEKSLRAKKKPRPIRLKFRPAHYDVKNYRPPQYPSALLPHIVQEDRLDFTHTFSNGTVFSLTVPRGLVRQRHSTKFARFTWEGQAPGKRQLQRYLIAVGTTIATQHSTIVILDVDLPTSTCHSCKSWILRPHKKPERIYEYYRFDRRLPFLEIRFDGHCWFPPIKVSQAKADEAYRKIERLRKRAKATRPVVRPPEATSWHRAFAKIITGRNYDTTGNPISE
jgi:hypothetical protein